MNRNDRRHVETTGRSIESRQGCSQSPISLYSLAEYDLIRFQTARWRKQRSLDHHCVRQRDQSNYNSKRMESRMISQMCIEQRKGRRRRSGRLAERKKRASLFGLKILLLIGTINDVIERVGRRVRVGEKLAQSLSVHPKIDLDMPAMWMGRERVSICHRTILHCWWSFLTLSMSKEKNEGERVNPGGSATCVWGKRNV